MAAKNPPSGLQPALLVPLWILAVLGTIMFLRAARMLFIPIVLAVLASYALYPVVRRLERYRLPNWVASIVVIAAAAAALGFGAYHLSDDVARVGQEFPAALRQVEGRVEEQLGFGPLDRIAPTVASMAFQGSTTVLTLLGNVVVVVFLTFFLTISAAFIRRQLLAIGSDLLAGRREASEVIDEVNAQIQRFIVVRLITGAFVWTATWLALTIVGAPQAALWGAMAGVLNSIPFFGPFIVSTGLAVVGLLSGGASRAVELAAIALVITSFEGWLITPPLLGRAARMNTVVVFLGLLLFGWVWGVWGTLLALPMLAVLKSVTDHVESLHPVARLFETE